MKLVYNRSDALSTNQHDPAWTRNYIWRRLVYGNGCFTPNMVNGRANARTK